MKQDRLLHRRQMIEYDRVFWQRGIRLAGMDEAGRGPLAGDVVAACVVMPPDPALDWVDDSKQLSPLRREKTYEQILQTALFVGVGRASAQEIDRINILQATKMAMRRAAEGAPADLMLIDAIQDLGLGMEQRGIVHGDAISYSIAAASIVAKVTRDREMLAWDQTYPQYGFAQHKGYGTRQHIEALRQYGPCPIHRTTFIGKFV